MRPYNKIKEGWKAGAAVLCAGLFYGYVLLPAGVRIPCLFYEVTGMRCPGCGVTALCLDLLHGRFSPQHNWGLVLAAPGLLWAVWAWQKPHLRCASKWVSWGLILFLLLWMVVRNIYHL